MATLGTLVSRGAIVVSLVLVTGCATTEEWNTWRAHPTHFASSRHLGFSVRNREGTAPRVRRDDVVHASIQSWWGKPIAVSQDQILER